MSARPVVRIDTPSTYTSIRGASWSSRLRALSMASAAEASSAFWPRAVVRCVSQACHATMAAPAAATTNAATVHTLGDLAAWACLAAPRAYTCSHGHSDCIAPPEGISGPPAGLRAESSWGGADNWPAGRTPANPPYLAAASSSKPTQPRLRRWLGRPVGHSTRVGSEVMSKLRTHNGQLAMG